LKTIIGLQESVFQQDILIVEDIVDSGQTIARVTEEISALGPNSVEVVSLLRKQRSSAPVKMPKYVGFEIPDRFVVGYGLDYQGLGRQLSDIYQVAD
ncbi:MAG: phosphoribosyltransferase, partial [Bacteroidota bacterium]